MIVGGPAKLFIDSWDEFQIAQFLTLTIIIKTLSLKKFWVDKTPLSVSTNP